MMRVSVLHRASFGFLMRHPWQLALALLGIAIGVAVMVAIDLANVSAERAFRLSMESVNGRTTHQVVGGPAGVPESVYRDLRVNAGLRNVAPVVSGDAVVGGVAVSILGIDVFAESGFRDYTSISGSSGEGGQGTADTISALLTRPGAVLLSRATSRQAGITDGNSVAVVVAGREVTAEIAGFIGNSDEAGVQGLLIVDIATAQEWLGMSGFLSRIDVRLDSDLAAERFSAQLPVGVSLMTAENRTEQSTSITTAFMTNLTAMSLLAMLVGVFLIYNSVSFAVVQRRGLIGVLRALGLTEGEAFRLILFEGIALGIVGSALGLAAGVWLGEKLLLLVAQSINDLYFRVSVTEVTLNPLSLAKGGTAGLTATILAAVVPASEAARYRPSLAIRRSSIEARAGRALRVLLAVGIATVAASGLLLSLSGSSLVAGLAALFMLILGIAFCIPTAVATLTGPLALVATRAD